MAEEQQITSTEMPAAGGDPTPLESRRDLPLHLGRGPLVGIENEDPAIGELLQSPVPLAGVRLEGVLHDPCPGLLKSKLPVKASTDPS